MACRGAPSFEKYLRDRLLGSRSEVATVLAGLAKDVSLADAASLTLETLPRVKTKRLRQLVDSFESWCEWIEEWQPRGWSATMRGRRVSVLAPGKSPKDYFPMPRGEVVAAAVDVDAVRFDHDIFADDSTRERKTRHEIIYSVLGRRW